MRAGFTKIFGQVPSQQVGEDLRRLEQEPETGMGTRADDPRSFGRMATS